VAERKKVSGLGGKALTFLAGLIGEGREAWAMEGIEGGSQGRE
jgi:hypothetical protein